LPFFLLLATAPELVPFFRHSTNTAKTAFSGQHWPSNASYSLPTISDKNHVRRSV
jgi:hypothetical protein